MLPRLALTATIAAAVLAFGIGYLDAGLDRTVWAIVMAVFVAGIWTGAGLAWLAAKHSGAESPSTKVSTRV